MPPQPHDRPPRPPSDKHHHVPPGTGTFGMLLFLAALTMLFAASLLGYLVIRYTSEQGPDLGDIALPWSLWISTAAILVSSYSMHLALENVRHERQTRFRNSMVVTLLLAVVFLLIQAPSLATLLVDHHSQMEAAEGFRLYGLIFFLILVHALHVIGGLVPMFVITLRAHAHRYDHEHYGPVKYLTMYWHFLDGVWVVMFAVFLLAG